MKQVYKDNLYFARATTIIKWLLTINKFLEIVIIILQQKLN